MPRPGFVLDVDRSTPPTLFWHGEGFRLEKLPAGRSRVIYAPEPHEAIDDIDTLAAAMGSANYATFVAEDEARFLDRSKTVLMVSD